VKKSIFIVVILTILSLVSFAQNREIYFKFSVHSRTELNKLTRIISIDNVQNKTVFAYANEKEFQNFLKLGYSYQILPNPSSLVEAKMASSREQMRNWDSYPTYDAYVSMMYQFAEDYPNLCEVESIGNTVNGRELLFAHISDNIESEEDEPEFMYTATMHGDELVGYVLMLRLIDYLLSNYGTDTQVTNLVNNLDIRINPLANPDGTFAGGNNTVNGAIRYNGNNIDLNRNFPDPEDGDHPDGNDWQPETVAMMNLADEHHFVLSANLHSGAEVVNYPWDTWQRRHADDDWWQTIAHQFADTAQGNSPYGYMTMLDDGTTNGYDWYSISGGRQDFMNYFEHCREMTLELSDTKMLPANELPDYWNFTKDSFLLYMGNALYGVRGVVTDENGNPLDALITVLNHDIDNSEVITDPEIGDYHRFLYPGNYDLQISAFGYLPQTFENINITMNDCLVLNAQLSQAQEVTISGIVSDSQTGEPLVAASVQLLNTTFNQILTNQNGYFEIENVPVGNYSVRISAENHGTLITEIFVTESVHTFNFQLQEMIYESFENGQFGSEWSFSGNANWFVDSGISYDGNHSARSGNIGDAQNSSLQITLSFTTASQISFWRKISSEAGYDFLKFYIDGIETDAWSGNRDWAEEIYNIPVGTHTLKWSYIKDQDVSFGSDCGWIDYFAYPSFSDIEGNSLSATNFKLQQNFPNPFRTSTTISFELSTEQNEQNEQQSISIYNIKGQRIKQLEIMNYELGINKISWDGKDQTGKQVQSGIYFYRMKKGNFEAVKKMIKIK